MSRKRIGRDFEEAREIAGGKPLGFVFHKNLEGLQPRGLGERGERQNSLFIFHTSRVMEITKACQGKLFAPATASKFHAG